MARYFLSERMKAEILRIIRKVDSIRGLGVKNDSDTISINPPGGGRQAPAGAGSGGGGDLRHFTLERDGGTDGDKDNEPDVTYTVKDADTDEILGTNIHMTGHGVRIANSTILSYATEGVGRIKDGTPIIVFSDERYAQTICPNPP